MHHLRVSASGGRWLTAPPGCSPAGTVTLTATVVLPTGNGQLPVDAHRNAPPVVSWDFAVEID